MISIKDIARLAGMSPATVSRVINQRRYVKPEIRDRILALIKETGYVPNHAARSMVLRRTFTVGIVIPDTFNMFQRQLFSIIEHRLEAYGYHSLFFFVKAEVESEGKCLRRLKAEKLDGVIMIHEVAEPAFYAYLASSSLPVVLCTFEKNGFPSVHVDEEKAAVEATEHLIKLGHRHIDLVSGSSFSFGAQRATGYRRALERQERPVEEDRMVFVSQYTPEAGRDGMRTLLSRGHMVTAVFAVTDELAIGAMRALYEAGLRVPEDVSVVGFDDIDISASLSPGLTTVRQPLHEMGERAAEMIHKKISDDPIDDQTAPFAHAMVVRESSRRLTG